MNLPLLFFWQHAHNVSISIYTYNSVSRVKKHFEMMKNLTKHIRIHLQYTFMHNIPVRIQEKQTKIQQYINMLTTRRNVCTMVYYPLTQCVSDMNEWVEFFSLNKNKKWTKKWFRREIEGDKIRRKKHNSTLCIICNVDDNQDALHTNFILLQYFYHINTFSYFCCLFLISLFLR